MKKIATILILLVIFGASVKAQQMPHFSQYLWNDYLLNPAVAGTKEYTPATLSFRSQWTGLKDAPITQTGSIHGSLGENMGVGGIVFNDRTGPTSNMGMQMSYAYRLKIDEKNKLSFGLSAILLQYTLDKSKLTVDQPGDMLMVNGQEKTLVPDANFGAYFYSDKYFAGFSVPQLFQNKIQIGNDLSEQKLARHYFLTGGYNFKLNEEFDVQPSVLLKAVSAAPVQADLNVKGTYKKFLWAGVSYRSKESVVALVGVIKNNFSFGYSYDITLTEIKNYSNGSNEFFISYLIPNKGSAAQH